MRHIYFSDRPLFASVRRFNTGHRLIVIVFVLILAACDTETPPPPTATFPILAASQTVAPAVPTSPPTSISVNVGEQNFTPGVPPLNAGNPRLTQTPLTAPTQATIPLQFVADDGLPIVGTLYAAPVRPAPTVLLLHTAGSNKEAWGLFAAQLQAAGRSVLAIDLRGSGATGGQPDWGKAPQDLNTVLARLSTLPGVDGQRISIVGAEVGANLAVGACADFAGCKTAILLSPTLDYQGIKPSDAMPRFANRPLLLVASRGDKASSDAAAALDKLAKGDHRLAVQEGSARGIGLLSAQPDLPGLIVQWLASHGA